MLLLFLILTVLANAEIRRSNGDGFRVEFSVVRDGRLVSDLLLMFLSDFNLGQCLMRCIQHLQCITVNYNEDERLCEILGEEFDESNADVSTKKWKNYGTQAAKANGGEFSEWSAYTLCTLSCGGGMQRRERVCKNGGPCYGAFVETRKCMERPCPTEVLTYTDWSEFTPCSVTCGKGKQIRKRMCKLAIAALGAESCAQANDMDSETRACPMDTCPNEKKVLTYTDWSVFTPCSVTCGIGTQIRNRTCKLAIAAVGAESCAQANDMDSETRACPMDTCPNEKTYTPWNKRTTKYVEPNGCNLPKITSDEENNKLVRSARGRFGLKATVWLDVTDDNYKNYKDVFTFTTKGGQTVMSVADGGKWHNVKSSESHYLFCEDETSSKH